MYNVGRLLLPATRIMAAW